MPVKAGDIKKRYENFVSESISIRHHFTNFYTFAENVYK